jgi:hypothetical protein
MQIEFFSNPAIITVFDLLRKKRSITNHPRTKTLGIVKKDKILMDNILLIKGLYRES